MKSAIKFYLLMLVFMVLCIFGIESAGFIAQINRVHLFRDYVVNTIDNNHTYDDEVHKSLMNTNLCPSCSCRVHTPSCQPPCSGSSKCQSRFSW